MPKRGLKFIPGLPKLVLIERFYGCALCHFEVLVDVRVDNTLQADAIPQVFFLENCSYTFKPKFPVRCIFHYVNDGCYKVQDVPNFGPSKKPSK